MNILRRAITRTAATVLITVLATTGVGTATAAPQPPELTLRALGAINPADDLAYPGGIYPGHKFYVAYTVTNTSAEPITVTGFVSSIATRVRDTWIEQGYASDYCDQYIVRLDSTDRQAFPQVVAPGETSEPMYDNVNYEFLYAADNPCQRMAIAIGRVTVADDDGDEYGDGDLPPISTSSGSSSSSSLASSLGSLAPFES